MTQTTESLTSEHRTKAVASAGFMLRHPARLLALGFGTGLSPVAPGTVATLWAWLSYEVLTAWVAPTPMLWLVIAASLLGWWASASTARQLNIRDPGCVVIDEIAAFWLVLWLLQANTWTLALLTFCLFRFFDAVKPGPVGWADRLCHFVDPKADKAAWAKIGGGIMLDDFVAAGCTLLVVLAIQWSVGVSSSLSGLAAYLR